MYMYQETTTQPDWGLQELEKGMANMLDAYNGPKNEMPEDINEEEDRPKDNRKKVAQAKQPARATGKRTRASQRNAGACSFHWFWAEMVITN